MFCLSEQITCIFFYIAIKFYISANHLILLFFQLYGKKSKIWIG